MCEAAVAVCKGLYLLVKKSLAHPSPGLDAVVLLIKSVRGGRGGRAGLSLFILRLTRGINGGGVKSFVCSVVEELV